jgi:hypothetical protein
MQQTFVLHPPKSTSFELRTQKSTQKSTQKAGKKKGGKRRQKGGKKVGKRWQKNTPKKHIAIYTTLMLIIRKNFLKHIPEPVLLLS